MVRVALSVRVSTERQQQAQTIEQQVTRLREYAASQADWEVSEAHSFRDDGYSGAKLNRPSLDALRDQAARAAFEVVLLTAPDRLARTYVPQMVLLEELERRGCRVQFLDRPLSDDPHDQLLWPIRGAVAEYERTLIADRMRRGRQAKLQSGRLLPWTRPPSGYRADPARPREPSLVRIDPAEAAIVSEWFDAYVRGGASLHALARRLTDRQIPSPAGRRQWTPSRIRGSLTNPCSSGRAAAGRYRTVPARQRQSALQPVGRGRALSPRPPEDWVTIPVPALVSAEQFAPAACRLATNRWGALRNTRPE